MMVSNFRYSNNRGSSSRAGYRLFNFIAQYKINLENENEKSDSDNHDFKSSRPQSSKLLDTIVWQCDRMME